MSRRLKTALPCLVPILLLGCATAAPKAPDNLCRTIPVRHYTAAQQSALADEIQAAPAGSTWPDWITDYLRLRDGVRACQATRIP